MSVEHAPRPAPAPAGGSGGGNAVIRFEGVSKRYRVVHTRLGQRYLYNDIARLLRRIAGLNGGGDGLEDQDFWALGGVSFEVRQGEVLGLVGPNGAGKTTVLKLLSQITEPTEGVISLRGRVGALIALGTGFHPELTGRENLFLYGSILGLKRAEIRRRFDEIVEFAELGDFIDMPLKRYSSGMHVRLGFSVASHLEPDILLIDEVLAVGDQSFRQKCYRRIEETFRKGATVILVSHERGMIERLCTRAILLHRGKIVADGRPGEILRRYEEGGFGRGETEPAPADGRGRKGPAPPVEVARVAIEDGEGREPREIESGAPARLRISYRASAAVREAWFFCRLFRGGVLVHETSTAAAGPRVGPLEPGAAGSLELAFDRLDLLAGSYTVNVGVRPEPAGGSPFHVLSGAATFSVRSAAKDGDGLVRLPHRWSAVP